jgi:oxygen-dependent protoporphyrinogen oxidase
VHLVVVGGGVAGLAAAAEATRRGARVTVLEGSARVGARWP